MTETPESSGRCINRIRLEFKVVFKPTGGFGMTCINRIRLEFKALSGEIWPNPKIVLIESDWNLKVTATADGVIVVLVLIESDWNLKGQRRTDSCGCRTGINRIRLEFKVIYNSYDIFSRQRINRIRLEFKGVQKSMKTRQVEVLIESDWNLKRYVIVPVCVMKSY